MVDKMKNFTCKSFVLLIECSWMAVTCLKIGSCGHYSYVNNRSEFGYAGTLDLNSEVEF